MPYIHNSRPKKRTPLKDGTWRLHASSLREQKLRRNLYNGTKAQILCFSVIMIFGLFLSLLIPLRPTVSEIEKRELTKFPAFSMQALLSGDYFQNVELWFADTFPFREELLSLNKNVQQLYIGGQKTQIIGEVQSGDEIPDAPVSVPSSETSSAPVSSAPVSSTPQSSAPESTVPQPSASPDATSSVPIIDAQGQAQTFGAVLLEGNSAFEYYNFVTAQANNYAAAVNKAADQLAGSAKVFDLVVPTSTGITLPDSLMTTINSSDQNKATEYLYSCMNANVQKISVYSTLMSHRNEYIYFRSDHHWTALGAYYAYTQFAQSAGFTPNALESYETMTFEGFLGSFYSATNQSAALAATPDTIVAYKPKSNTSVEITQPDGTLLNWFVINDVTNYGAGSKYSTFIGGDNPFTKITNKDLQDGSSIVVVKESFGNAFVPFLVDHYQTVYVIDYRYWSGNLVNFVKENSVGQVLFVNNISATRSDSLISKISALS